MFYHASITPLGGIILDISSRLYNQQEELSSGFLAEAQLYSIISHRTHNVAFMIMQNALSDVCNNLSFVYSLSPIGNLLGFHACCHKVIHTVTLNSVALVHSQLYFHIDITMRKMHQDYKISRHITPYHM